MANSMLPISAIILGFVLPWNGGASAQADVEAVAQAGPAAASAPLRAARLTFLAGAVQIQRNDNTGEDSAVLNMPLAEGTRVVTGDYGQAEIEFEDGSIARLTPRSTLSLDSLALDSAQVAHSELGLLGGLAYFELRKSSAATWMVNAVGTRVTPIENLTLRLSIDEPPADFAVLAGAARLERSGSFNVELRSGETLRLDSRDPARYFLAQQVTQQSWDSWNESRDQAAADAADKRTAARDGYSGEQGYGWSDLDANGSWYNVPGAGANSGLVWQPYNADEGFDPYGFGNWIWGGGSYVWASGYSWGWTPFRCGHWQFFPGFGWGWTPDLSCGRWAFAGGGYYGSGNAYGGGIFVRGNYPPRHNPVVRPQPRPGGPHPVIPVRGPDGPRPPTIHRGQVRIAGSEISALPSIALPASRSGSALGQSLARDFPMDRRTHQPMLGIVSGSTSPTGSAHPAEGARIPRLPAAVAPQPADAGRAADPGRSTRNPGNAAPPADLGRIAPSTRLSERTPPASVPSPSTPPPPVHSAQPPPPVRYTPPPPPVQYSPPPAPVHSSPPPPPPAPAPSRPAPPSPKPS